MSLFIILTLLISIACLKPLDELLGIDNNSEERADEANAKIAAASNATIQGQREAIDFYKRAMLAQLQMQTLGENKSLAAQLAGAQQGGDLYRQMYDISQQQQMPYRIASQSALQALPQMQSLLGMPAYDVPKTVSATNVAGSGRSYYDEFKAIWDRVNTDNPATITSDNQATKILTTPTPGTKLANVVSTPSPMGSVRDLGTTSLATPTTTAAPTPQTQNVQIGQHTFDVNSPYVQFYQIYGRLPSSTAELGQLLPPSQKPVVSPPSHTPTTSGGQTPSPLYTSNQGVPVTPGTTSDVVASQKPGVTPTDASQTLQSYSGPVANISESPLYKWRQDQALKQIKTGLAAKGLLNSGYADRLQNDAIAQLTGEETDKLYTRLQNMASMGMGFAPQAGQSAQQAGGTLASVAGQAGSGMSNTFNQAAAGRSNIYGQAGQTIGGTMAGIGATQGQAGLQQAQNLYNVQPGSIWPAVGTAIKAYGMFSGSPYGYFGSPGSWSNPGI